MMGEIISVSDYRKETLIYYKICLGEFILFILYCLLESRSIYCCMHTRISASLHLFLPLLLKVLLLSANRTFVVYRIFITIKSMFMTVVFCEVGKPATLSTTNISTFVYVTFTFTTLRTVCAYGTLHL